METMYILIKGGGIKFICYVRNSQFITSFVMERERGRGGGGAIAMLIKMKIKINLNGLK